MTDLPLALQQSGVPAYLWEKKGAALYTTENVLRYPALRRAMARLLNRIEKDEGMVFYVGMQKTHSPEDHDPKALYRAVLREAIKRLDDFCGRIEGLFMIVIDELQDRKFREAFR